MDDRCKKLESPNILNFVISCGIVIGILVSYLPQHYRIIARRSSEGLSPYFVLLGTTSGTCAIANILVLPTSRADIGCCSVNGSFACAAGLLGILQVGIQWSCFFLVSFLFLIFIPREGLALHALKYPLKPTWREAVAVVLVSLLHFIATFITSVIIVARYADHLQLWANVLGVACAVLACLQYIPQIYTTWKLQEASSLSIVTMCIQTPGSFIFATSLALRLGTNGWSAWSVYIVTGSLQGCLLILCLVLEARTRNINKTDHSSSGDVGDEGRESSPNDGEETTPLLV